MAVGPTDHPDEENTWYESVLVTPEAQHRLSASDVWHHLGGWSDDGDCYDTQLGDFAVDLDEFWCRLAGPDETLRRRIMDALKDIRGKWRTATVTADGIVTVRFEDKPDRVLRPPVDRSQSPA